jgi:hypothetical protein
MYTDTDEEAARLEKADVLFAKYDTAIEDWVKSRNEEIISKPCLPCPSYTSEEEVNELVRKRMIMETDTFTDDLIPQHRFRKLLCGAIEEANFRHMEKRVNDDFINYTTRKEIRTKLSY